MTPEERTRIEANGFELRTGDHNYGLWISRTEVAVTTEFFFKQTDRLNDPWSMPLCTYLDKTKAWHIVPNSILVNHVKPNWWEAFGRSFTDLDQAMAYLKMLMAANSYEAYEVKA